MPSRRPRPSSRQRPPSWASLDDEALLDLRLCDLQLTLEDNPLLRRMDAVLDELHERGIRLRPHVWVSSEFFSPDNVPGIAVPFYLAHPRLMRLEKQMMLTVEGGSREQCLRILRHELGHAVDHAYRLHFRPLWRETFGSYAQPYPRFYQPQPYSHHYVLHLDRWYAQAHPAEDFAETFAVWLTPDLDWRKQYEGWPALAKLEAVDLMMRDIAGKPPAVRTRQRLDPLASLKITLREHYRQRRDFYATRWPEFLDRDLFKLFSSRREHHRRPAAVAFLNDYRPQLRRLVARWTGAHPYTIDQVLVDMIERCRVLKLRLAVSDAVARRESLLMVTVQTVNYLHRGYQRVAL